MAGSAQQRHREAGAARSLGRSADDVTHLRRAHRRGAARPTGGAALGRRVRPTRRHRSRQLDAWVEHRGERAGHELCDALPTVDETGRGLAFGRCSGRAPHDRGCRDTARARRSPDFVTVFRVTRSPPLPMMDRPATRRLGPAAPPVIELWGPGGRCRPGRYQHRASPGSRRCSRPPGASPGEQTEVVLAAIGGRHAASESEGGRKALFKHRSATERPSTAVRSVAAEVSSTLVRARRPVSEERFTGHRRSTKRPGARRR